MLSTMKGFDNFPQDIFREIIQHAYVHSPARRDREAHYQPAVHSPPIVASHVCRSWRRVLLSDPTMWTCILVPGLKPDGIMELLRRSDSALLNVFLELDTCSKLKREGTSNTFSTLFQQIHRFKTLYVYVYPEWSDWTIRAVNYVQASINQILPYLQRPAPKLQFFCFKHIEFVASAANLGEAFLDTLFSGVAPNLKHIHRDLVDGTLRQLRPNPLFCNLSELFLTTPNDSFVVDSDLLLDVLELSPCLKLFNLQVNWNLDSNVGATRPRDRKINLPRLQRLVLNVNRAVGLLDVLLHHLSFPSNIGWKITSEPVELATLPPLLQLLSQTQFTSLHIFFSWDGFVAFSFKENRNPICIDLVDNRELVYVYADTCHITTFWDSMHSVKLSNITRAEFNVGMGRHSQTPITFQTIFTLLKNLETLFVRQHPNQWFNGYGGADESCLICLSALIPKSNHSASSERSSMTSFPCPLLREITVELKEPLSKAHATVFRGCSDRRQAEGYPLQLFVCCTEIEDTILHPGKNGSIHVSIVDDDEY